MKIAYITAGAAGMYCGTCMHDNTLAASLMERGHEVSLLPTYTPTRTDEGNVAGDKVFFGALNVYLQQLGLFRNSRLMDRLLDNRRVLRWVSKMAGKSTTDASDLGALTHSMLCGETGHQAKELDKLIDFMDEHIQPDVVHVSLLLFAGFA
ncbi:MAG: glycosyltransferase family 1 protein, partial [Acidobacteriota bacterium]